MSFNKLLIAVLAFHLISVSHVHAECLLNENLNSYSPVNGMSDAEENGWSHYTDFGMDFWRVLPASGVSLSNAFSVAEETQISLLGITDSFLVTPVIHLTDDNYLSFSHKYDFEADSSYYDGGQLQITTNNGSSWSDLNQYISSGGYNEIISSSFSSPIQGQLAWAGEQAFFNTVQVDLSVFANQTIQIRWRYVSGLDSIAQLGWRIDNIIIADIEPLSEVIFASSFEPDEQDICP